MAKNTSLIHLATAFLAVIGGNAAVLTAYILIYPSITESSPSEYNMARSSDTAVTQSDVITDETTYTFPDTVQNTRTVPENQENIIVDNTLLDRTVAEYDPAKQDIFNNLAQERQRSENQERQLSEPEQNTLDNYVPAQNTQESPVVAQETQEIHIPVQKNTQEVPAPLPATQSPVTPESSIYVGDSQNNANNSSPASINSADQYTTYEAPPLQTDTNTETYIINTTSGYFHIKNNQNCKYLRDYTSPTEKQETNLSREELLSQGYQDCRFCFG